MTATRTTPRGPHPTRDDVARAVQRLADLRHYRDRYPYTCGALGEIVHQLAELHAHCRKTHCATCYHLRSGLAWISALQEGEDA
jgi:hypothetical protein